MSATTQAKSITVRDAASADLEAIRSIYNYYVANSTATFDLEPQTAQQRADWFREHQRDRLPVLVAEVDGTIIGWGSLSRYHSRCAYKGTVEFSIYIHPDHLRRGLGKMLLNRLISIGRQRRYHCVLGLICSENTSSIDLSRSLGFEKVGELKEVGKKNDRWLNVTLMEKIL